MVLLLGLLGIHGSRQRNQSVLFLGRRRRRGRGWRRRGSPRGKRRTAAGGRGRHRVVGRAVYQRGGAHSSIDSHAHGRHHRQQFGFHLEVLVVDSAEFLACGVQAGLQMGDAIVQVRQVHAGLTSAEIADISIFFVLYLVRLRLRHLARDVCQHGDRRHVFLEIKNK